MKVLKEVTKWAEPAARNHVYFVDDSRSKMFAYVQDGAGTPFKFKNPIRIDTRGRKFVEVPNSWNFGTEDVAVGKSWQVIGSRGDVYTVIEDHGNLTCTCSGFKFRGECKHIKLPAQ
jgi:hypothetical protein